MKLPKWLKPYVKAEDLQAISNAVSGAEEICAAEIVPVIVGHSVSAELLSVIFFLTFELGVILLSWTLTPHLTRSEQFFGTLTLTLIAAPLALWMWRFPRFFRLFLLSPRLSSSAARRRATEEFFDLKVSRTKNHNGVLLFVSVLERQAVILGDSTISEHITPEKWQHILVSLTDGLREKHWLMGFEKAIAQTAELLKSALPPVHDKKNEIANRLIIKN